LTNGNIYCSGWNEHGNLGVGDRTDRPAFTHVDLPPPVPYGTTTTSRRRQFAVGGAHMMVV
jgi:alpha-tubulin suppressor-like RCC1 family protein